MGRFPLPKAYFVALFCEAILHGIYTVLFGAAMYLLLAPRKRQTKRSSTTNIAMTILTLLMYGLATAHISLSLYQNLIAFFDQRAADGGLTVLNEVNSPLVYSQIAIEVINCLLGDSIVCWRTWVLWGKDNRLIIAPVLCILGGVGSAIGLVHAFAVSPAGDEVYNAEISKWFGVFAGLTAVANIYAVCAISYKAWQSMRVLRYLSSSVVIHGGRYYGTLLVVIESGVLYSVALIITITLFATDNNGVYVITDMLGHLTGIYPTGIIVLVCLKMTFHDDVTRAGKVSTMQYERNSRGFNTSGGTAYGNVLHLRKDGGTTDAGTGITSGTTGVTVVTSTTADSDYEMGVRAPRPWAPPGKWKREDWYESNAAAADARTMDLKANTDALV